MVATRRTVLTALGAAVLAGCSRSVGRPSATAVSSSLRPADASPSAGTPDPGRPGPVPLAAAPAIPLTRAEVVAAYGHLAPRTWGFGGPGVVRGLAAPGRVIALTFDACGGPGGGGYDQALITFLRRRDVPATLFLNSRWIEENPAVFRQLAAEPLFELANHGTRHLPLSVTGRSAYGIPGTRDAGQVYDEVAGNQAKLTALPGTPPRFFRAGTAFSDDVAARIVAAMAVRLVTFSVNGDGGATFTPGQVARTVGAAPAGSVVLCHMNHPAGGTAPGIAAAVPRLLAAGYRFARLSDQLR